MGVTITGAEGRVRWAYHHAATLRAWTITKDEFGVWSIAGTLADVDDFTVSQRPLKFEAPNGWRWPLESLQIVDASFSGVLGPKESNHALSDRSA